MAGQEPESPGRRRGVTDPLLIRSLPGGVRHGWSLSRPPPFASLPRWVRYSSRARLGGVPMGGRKNGAESAPLRHCAPPPSLLRGRIAIPLLAAAIAAPALARQSNGRPVAETDP